MTTLHVVCEGSSVHTDSTDPADAWLRPRPRWLKVDPHRAQISDEFTNWCGQRGVEVVDSAGNAKEQQGKVEHHAHLFELLLEGVLAGVQPQTKYERRECLDALQEAKNSLLSVSDVSPMHLVFGRTSSATIPIWSRTVRCCTTEALEWRRGFGRSRERS